MGKGKDKEFNYQIPSQAMQTEFGKIHLFTAKIDLETTATKKKTKSGESFVLLTLFFLGSVLLSHSPIEQGGWSR